MFQATRHQRAHQRQRFRLAPLAAIECEAEPAFEGPQDGTPSMQRSETQLAVSHGFPSIRPQRRSAQYSGDIKAVPSGLSAGHFQFSSCLQHGAQSLPPVPPAVQSVGQHIHGPPGKGDEQGTVAAAELGA